MSQDMREVMDQFSQVDEMAEFSYLQERLYQIDRAQDQDISERLKKLYSEGMDAAFISAGWGEYNRQITNNFSRMDRYRARFVMDNYLRTGYTFITRPELNLQSTNLKMNRVMNLLNTMEPTSIGFAIRAYLDTRLAKVMSELTCQCPYLDYRSPFFTILSNNLQDFSGGPSYQLNVFTDEEGYYGESQSMAIGSDSYKKPFDLQMNFVDPVGGPIDAIMKFWTKYIELLGTGEMIMYPDQLNDRVLNYTVSIYRFIMDPTFRYVRKWAKYTGCFPISAPGASVFDFNSSDTFVESLRKFSIGFRCGSGVVDVDDPTVIDEFNMLVERYFPPIRCLRKGQSDALSRMTSRGQGQNYVNNVMIPEDTIDATLKSQGLRRNPLIPEFNYTGLPYIIDTERGLRLEVISGLNELDRGKVSISDKPDEKTKAYNLRFEQMAQAALDIATRRRMYEENKMTLIQNYEDRRAARVAARQNGVSYV